MPRTAAHCSSVRPFWSSSAAAGRRRGRARDGGARQARVRSVCRDRDLGGQRRLRGRRRPSSTTSPGASASTSGSGASPSSRAAALGQLGQREVGAAPCSASPRTKKAAAWARREDSGGTSPARAILSARAKPTPLDLGQPVGILVQDRHRALAEAGVDRRRQVGEAVRGELHVEVADRARLACQDSTAASAWPTFIPRSEPKTAGRVRRRSPASPPRRARRPAARPGRARCGAAR